MRQPQHTQPTPTSTLTTADINAIISGVCVSVLPKQRLSICNAYSDMLENDKDYQNNECDYQYMRVLRGENE